MSEKVSVPHSIVRLIKTHPMPGWIRADRAAESIAATEILRLKKTIEDLQTKLKNSRLAAPVGAESLAQEDEEFPIELSFDVNDANGEEWTLTRTARYSWNEIFEEIGPHLMVGASDDEIQLLLNKMITNWVDDFIETDADKSGYNYPRSIEIASRDEHTIKIQLRALGLIERKEQGNRSVWTLTPYGDSVLVKLIAIEAGEFDESDGNDEVGEPNEPLSDDKEKLEIGTTS